MAQTTEQQKVQGESVLATAPRADPYRVILFPLSTEKAIRQIEFENKLTFVVNPRATKPDVRTALEELFKVKITKITIQNSIKGQKRAVVTLGPQYLASDISADLGLI